MTGNTRNKKTNNDFEELINRKFEAIATKEDIEELKTLITQQNERIAKQNEVISSLNEKVQSQQTKSVS